MYPSRSEAESLLYEAETCNPGPWGDHSRTAAHCAACIARQCGLDPEKAYVLGLLHDIGRRFGKRHLGHVVDGFVYMTRLGWDEPARVCLSHSFPDKNLDDYVGRRDTTPAETALLEWELGRMEYDVYDYLIQLCDALAGAEGVLEIEARMEDVRRRYGAYPQMKWDANLALLRRFEQACGGQSIYAVVDKAHFHP